MTGNKGLAKTRGKSRQLAMQAIYQWQMTSDDISGIRQQFLDESSGKDFDLEYFSEIIEGVVANLEEIDQCLSKYLDREVNSVDPVERSIIRVGCYEFLKRMDVPYRVILNEAVNLTKKFCAEQSHTFVNAVLDKVAHELRVDEINTSQ